MDAHVQFPPTHEPPPLGTAEIKLSPGASVFVRLTLVAVLDPLFVTVVV
jgi:hypothetical protein